MQRAVRFGITGKMGSGKSTVTKLLAEQGFVIVNTDDVAKQLMVDEPSVRQAVAALLGEAAYTNGQLDRSFVANQIFSNRDKRLALEAIVHPAVTEAMEQVFESSPEKSVAVESALILQTELWLHFDYILLIDAADDAVVQRLATKGRFTGADVRQRLLEQHYDHIQREEADFVLENNGTEAEFSQRARSLITILKLLGNRKLPDAPLHAIFEEDEEDASPAATLPSNRRPPSKPRPS